MERKLKQEGISEYVWLIQGFPAGLNRKESCLQFGRPGFHPWVGKTAWRRQWLPTPVFLPGESHGERSPVGYSPWGHKELETAERLTLHISCGFTLLYGRN